MSTIKELKDHSLITVIVPNTESSNLIQAIGKLGIQNTVHIGARGTILSESNAWYHRMFPPPSPKQEIVQFLAPNEDCDAIMHDLTVAGGLHVSGAGAIYSIPCDDVHAAEGYKLYEKNEDLESLESKDSKEFVAIVCIVEMGAAEPIAKGAIMSGSPGPTVSFAEGRGLRDKIRVLRLTKTAEKEIVTVVVEDCDEDHVFSEMSRAGRITEPGRGFIYTVPVGKGLINLASTESDKKYSASMQEIISALDELKGGKHWRGANAIGKPAKQKKSSDQKYLKDLVNMTCIVPRDHADAVLDTILSAGAPAASAAYGKVTDAQETKKEVVSINKEWALVQSILAPNLVEKVRSAIFDACELDGTSEMCTYTFPVPKAQTYLG